MAGDNYTSHFSVTADAATAYAAIIAVRDWWTGEIEGSAARVGDEFTYRFKDFHVSRQRVTALVPGAKIAWHVVDGAINFVANKAEWDGTHIVFDITPIAGGSEVRITHYGLNDDKECLAACSQGWNANFKTNLKAVIDGREQSGA